MVVQPQLSPQSKRTIPIKEKVGTYRMFYLKPGLELVVDDMRYRVIRITKTKVICRCIGRAR